MAGNGTVKLVNWNAQWATPRSWRCGEALQRVEPPACEVVGFTETDCRLLARDGPQLARSLTTGPDYRETARDCAAVEGALECVDDLRSSR